MNEKDNILGDAVEQSQELEDIIGNYDEISDEEGTIEEEQGLESNEGDTSEDASGDEEESTDEDTDVIDNPEVLGNSEEVQGIKNKANKVNKIIMGLCAVVVLAVIALIAVLGKKPTDEKTLKVDKDFVLSVEDASKFDKIESVVNTLYEKNAYITVHMGEEDTRDVYMMYNKSKECYIESGYNSSLAVMRNDYKAVALTNPVNIAEDVGILSSIERAVELGRAGYAEILSESTESKDGEPTITYFIGVVGKHNIRKMYTVVSNDYADTMMTNIFEDKYNKELYKDLDYTDEKDEDTLEIQVIVGEKGEVAAKCTVTIEGFNYINWWFDGYMSLSDFKLDEKWYSEDNDTDTWVKLAEDLQSTLSDNINNYIDENLTEEEIGAIEEDAKSTGDNVDTNTKSNGLFVKEYVRPTGDLTAEEKAYWDQMDTITQKILNEEEVTDEEKSLYYALPASNPEE